MSPPRENNRNRNDPSPRLAGRIDTIAGGRAGGGDSRNSRNNYARREVYSSASVLVCVEEISFSDAELQGIELPHDDPMTIAPVLANYSVDRMLVDTGSIGEMCGKQKKTRICYQTSVSPLEKEPKKTKKRRRENYPEVMSTIGEAQKDNDNSPKE
ncbi:hypothetical protein LIER_10193 [Lithospermum erythrorhizon]|uniref:Uncharacterized protein n=1 Tax=Lithospermum erythrorhizon TaxID=34254 RepID=A0AAV3PIH0_LITER